MEKPIWMDFSRSLIMEWKQAKEEGRDVEGLKGICEFISQKSDEEGFAPLAEEVLKMLGSADTAAGYEFFEPSAYKEIAAAAPSKRHTFAGYIDEDELRGKIKGAWMGRISGCLLGKPIEGMMSPEILRLMKLTGNYPLHRYIRKSDFAAHEKEIRELLGDCWDRIWWADLVDGAAPVDDDTNYTVLYLKLIETYGVDFSPSDVIDAWLSWMPMLESSTAERITYRNAAMGIKTPETAVHHNPCREWIGAQIRADFFGYIHPGRPDKAAEMAWRDACVSHVKNGIYGEMFAAAMIAAAFMTDDVMTILQAGLDEIPEKSRLKKEVERIIGYYEKSVTAEEVIKTIHADYNEKKSLDWCHTLPNAMIVAMALLYGEGDFEKSICLAVQAAFDTDCNGATVGSVMGILCGGENIPDKWVSLFCGRLLTGISGYQNVSIDELAEKTIALSKTVGK